MPCPTWAAWCSPARPAIGTAAWAPGLRLSNVVLVGARDLDPHEKELIAAGQLKVVETGPNLPARLAAAVGMRDVYVHLDCDVLEPGIVPIEYQVSGGLSLDDLRACATIAGEAQGHRRRDRGVRVRMARWSARVARSSRRRHRLPAGLEPHAHPGVPAAADGIVGSRVGLGARHITRQAGDDGRGLLIEQIVGADEHFVHVGG